MIYADVMYRPKELPTSFSGVFEVSGAVAVYFVAKRSELSGAHCSYIC